MRSRRPGTSFTFIGGALLLLVAIAVGQRLGDRVLRQATEQRTTTSGVIMTPVPQASDDPFQARNWKREQIVSVATDPAFPDPRATPVPTPTPTRRPIASPTIAPPTATPTAEPLLQKAPEYTSPPLPIPIASHAPQDIETEPPDANGFPQGVPPVTPDPGPSRQP